MARGRDEERRYDKANHRQNLLRTTSVAGGRRDEERRLKENAGAMTMETNVKTLPRATSVAGGRDERAKTTRNGKVAQPTVSVSYTHLTLWGSRLSHFMIIPNTKRNPNKYENGPLAISEVITGLPRQNHKPSPPR